LRNCLYSDVELAYGNYNDLVRRAASIRGQSLVLWDFEYVSVLLLFGGASQLLISSRDSLGASAAESKALYLDLANRHPSNALALNHESLGA